MGLVFILLVLFGTSLIALLIERKLKSANFLTFTFKVVPATCACMGLSFIAISAALGNTLLGLMPVKAYAALSLFLLFLIFMFGLVFVCYKGGERGFSLLKALSAFGVGFIYSTLALVASQALAIIIELNTWRGVEIHPDYTCEINYQHRATPTPAYNMKISFESGKEFGLFVDYGGHSKFKVYKLKDGNLYLEDIADISPTAYVINPKLEKVYMRLGDGIAELKSSDILWGKSGSIDSGKASFYTKDKDGSEGKYESDISPYREVLDTAKLAGTVFPGGFRICEERGQKK